MSTNYDLGVSASPRTGNTDSDGERVGTATGPVYYDEGLVGAGISKRHNGILTDYRRLSGKDSIGLHIHEVTADFSVTGNTAQSHLQRQFHARFFTQPRITVRGQCVNQYEYNRLARYVREAQINALVGAPTGDNQADYLQFHLKEGKGIEETRTTKGQNESFKLLGYIENIRAGAERFIVAPEFEFVFVVINATDGILSRLDKIATDPSAWYDPDKKFLGTFDAAIDDPKISAPKPWGAETGRPQRPPTRDENPVEGTPFDGVTLTYAQQIFAND